MKIVRVSNFQDETVNDRLICDHLDLYYGALIMSLFDKHFNSASAVYYFKLVDDDYKLYTYQP